MGVRWELYCPTHHEAFNAGKYRGLEGLEDLLHKSPADALDALRRAATANVQSDRERPAVDRWMSLVEAFIERHAGCSIGLANNSSLRDDQASERERDWRWFDYFEDRNLCDLEDALIFKVKPSYDTPMLKEFRANQYDLLETMRTAPLPPKFPPG